MDRLIYWTPRILCMLFIGFVSMFALDVFGEGKGFFDTLVALLIHLIPSFVLAALLAIAWRWEWVGAVGFTICAALFLYVVRSNMFGKMLFVVPCLLVAALFYLSWRARTHRREQPST